jgi:hypothetical protein
LEKKMKISKRILIGLALILIAVPGIYAQDLSTYRGFSLGTGLPDLSKKIFQHPADADVIVRSPALIQELSWRPFTESDPVEKVIFSFYNGGLYMIDVTYSDSSTAGLTAADMVRAISSTYGPATTPIAETVPSPSLNYRAPETSISKWENAQDSITLSHTSFFNRYQLIMVTKELDAKARAATIEAAKQQLEDAPQKALDRAKKEADDLEVTRAKNVRAFRP